MKKNEFFESMSNVDASLIERADRRVTVKSRGRTVKIAAIAASFALLVVGLAAILPALVGEDKPIVQDVVVWDNIFNMFSPGNSDELTVGESKEEDEIVIAETAFAEIVSGEFRDYEIGFTISFSNNGAYLGEKLGEVDIRSGWYLQAEGKEKDVKTVKAEVYEIGGVARKAAVAIKYLEKCAANSDYFAYYYYVAVNKNYELTTLSEFFADLNAYTYMSMSHDALLFEVPRYPAEKLNIDKYKFKYGADDKIRDLILSFDSNREIVGYYDESGVSLKKGTKTLQLLFVLQTSPGTIHHIYVFEDGNIAIDGFDEGAAIFNVGTEATDELWALFAEYAELETNEYGEDDLVEATTGEVNE